MITMATIGTIEINIRGLTNMIIKTTTWVTGLITIRDNVLIKILSKRTSRPMRLNNNLRIWVPKTYLALCTEWTRRTMKTNINNGCAFTGSWTSVGLVMSVRFYMLILKKKHHTAGKSIVMEMPVHIDTTNRNRKFKTKLVVAWAIWAVIWIISVHILKEAFAIKGFSVNGIWPISLNKYKAYSYVLTTWPVFAHMDPHAKINTSHQ